MGKMVLAVGSEAARLFNSARTRGISVECHPGSPPTSLHLWKDFKMIVSFGYRHIFPPDFISKYSGLLLNIHVSLLPWNRGAHPNFWSWFDRTPKGVSIHVIDRGIDTGPLLFQEEIQLDPWLSLRQSHETLLDAGAKLFDENAPDILRGSVTLRSSPKGSGSFHTVEDFNNVKHLLSDGWETTGLAVEQLGRSLRARP